MKNTATRKANTVISQRILDFFTQCVATFSVGNTIVADAYQNTNSAIDEKSLLLFRLKKRGKVVFVRRLIVFFNWLTSSGGAMSRVDAAPSCAWRSYLFRSRFSKEKNHCLNGISHTFLSAQKPSWNKVLLFLLSISLPFRSSAFFSSNRCERRICFGLGFSSITRPCLNRLSGWLCASAQVHNLLCALCLYVKDRRAKRQRHRDERYQTLTDPSLLPSLTAKERFFNCACKQRNKCPSFVSSVWIVQTLKYVA